MEEINFRTVKIFDIGYVTIIYFIIGIIYSRLFDKYFGIYDPKEDAQKNFVQVSLEIIGIIWLIGASTYIVRNIVELIPSPFDGLGGFVHNKLKEIGGAGVFTLIVMGYTYHLRSKLDQYNRRLNRVFDVPIPNIYLTPKLSEKNQVITNINK
jgi:hypothetical protein